MELARYLHIRFNQIHRRLSKPLQANDVLVLPLTLVATAERRREDSTILALHYLQLSVQNFGIEQVCYRHDDINDFRRLTDKAGCTVIRTRGDWLRIDTWTNLDARRQEAAPEPKTSRRIP